MEIHTILTTMVLVLDPEHKKVLLVNRRKRNWQGYAAPGGHVDFPESLMACAIREVKEETGLTVEDLHLISISHFVGTDCGEDYLVFNYMTDRSSGVLAPGEGEDPAEWVPLDRVYDLPLADGFRERLEGMLAGQHAEFYAPWSSRGDEPLQIIPM